MKIYKIILSFLSFAFAGLLSCKSDVTEYRNDKGKIEDKSGFKLGLAEYRITHSYDCNGQNRTHTETVLDPTPNSPLNYNDIVTLKENAMADHISCEEIELSGAFRSVSALAEHIGAPLPGDDGTTGACPSFFHNHENVAFISDLKAADGGLLYLRSNAQDDNAIATYITSRVRYELTVSNYTLNETDDRCLIYIKNPSRNKYAEVVVGDNGFQLVSFAGKSAKAVWVVEFLDYDPELGYKVYLKNRNSNAFMGMYGEVNDSNYPLYYPYAANGAAKDRMVPFVWAEYDGAVTPQAWYIGAPQPQ